MITEQALIEAIAECQGQKEPNANTCRNLASYFIIKDHMYNSNEIKEPISVTTYSYDAGYTNSELSYAIQDLGLEKVLPVLDELLDAVQVTDRKLYASFWRKLNE